MQTRHLLEEEIDHTETLKRALVKRGVVNKGYDDFLRYLGGVRMECTVLYIFQAY